MNNYKVLIVGLGSMGCRRIRLLQAFFGSCTLAATDLSAERRRQASEQFGIPIYSDIDNALQAFSPDVGFVCTSPLSHSGIIKTLLEGGMHVFTEINLVDDGYEQNNSLAASSKLTLFLSSTQIYRREIQYIEDRLKEAGTVAYRYHVGQYLPDWHPWESYREFFVSDRRTGGCVELLAIEFPWLERAFGTIRELKVNSLRLSTLELDYNDTIFLTLSHEGGSIGQLLVDLVSRKATRSLEILSENLYISWNGKPNSLRDYDIAGKKDRKVDAYQTVLQDIRYADNIVENAYVDEMTAFFDTLEGRKARRHSFSDDARLLDIIHNVCNYNGR